MNRIPEEDWKVFKEHHLLVHEEFCSSVSSQISRINESDDLSAISKFQSIAELIVSAVKKEEELFLDYRRSTAMLYLLKFVNEGLLSSEKVEEYSQEVKEWLDLRN